MVEYLDDSHTFVYWPGKAFFRGNSAEDERLEAEFSLPLILESHLTVIDSSSAEGYVYGSLTGRNVGYLHLSGIDLTDKEFGDRLLENIGHHEAIIIDLRNNAGGDDNAGADLAARFSDREELVYTVQERNGPGHNDFADKTGYFLRKAGPVPFTRPVVVLTDKVTVSAAEVMLLYLKALPHVTQIGTATSGDFSDTGMRRFLPNGWQYQYSIMKFLLPDGVTSLDGIGHVPDVEIRNSAEDIAAGNDRVLARACTYLFEEFGIR
jgi:C-terminal processing protease CtpA/Prc